MSLRDEIPNSLAGADADTENLLIGTDISDDEKPFAPTRRGFLQGSAKKLGYAAPIVLLFRPKQACASGGSQLTQA